MLFWLTLFVVCVTGMLALGGYCIAVLAGSRHRPASPVVIETAPPPPPEPPPPEPPPPVPPDEFVFDDAATRIAARQISARPVDGYETTQLARPYRSQLREAKTTIRHITAYRATRGRPHAS